MPDEPIETTPDDSPSTPPVEGPQLFGQVPSLVRPKSIAERYDVLLAREQGDVQENRLLACALALAWPAFRRRLQRRGVHYAGDVATFGGAAFEVLVEHGGSGWAGVLAWGRAALDVLAQDLPGLELPAGKQAEEDALGN